MMLSLKQRKKNWFIHEEQCYLSTRAGVCILEHVTEKNPVFKWCMALVLFAVPTLVKVICPLLITRFTKTIRSYVKWFSIEDIPRAESFFKFIQACDFAKSILVATALLSSNCPCSIEALCFDLAWVSALSLNLKLLPARGISIDPRYNRTPFCKIIGRTPANGRIGRQFR